jgi:site-specific DNA-methyltransferase (adenine-specific)
MALLISIHIKPSDFVLDPFCGSGSSLIAAKQLGGRFVGIEIVPEYSEATAYRLEDVRPAGCHSDGNSA